MKNFYTEEQWNEILKQQESVLRYDTFTRKQALELGLLIAEIDGGNITVRSLSASWRTRRPSLPTRWRARRWKQTGG